eukprot:CAMPEP_0171270080 /NCGR_PEP_ID=MMETSP0790-20130122/60523_1 /TAXON_ID=2925 /ORGANISM="Alexandrium catenella, Strain OF101" /LENGTH=156 /DNA_ID=CAMNT_0011738903 /DNA_START=387 /DNA_END=857 /DNA_ORIENTATION=-
MWEADGDRRHAVRVLVLEAHRPVQVHPRAVDELHATCVHNLLALHPRRVDAPVGVQGGDVVVRLHVDPVVSVADGHGDDERHDARHGEEEQPGGGLARGGLLAGPSPDEAEDRGDAHQAVDDPGDDRDGLASSGVPVVHAEGQHRVDEAEAEPWHK